MKKQKDIILEKSNAYFQAVQVDPIWTPGPLHYHNYIEVEFIASGSGEQIFNGEKFDLNPGDFYILKPLDSHKIWGTNMVIQKLIIQPNFLSQWLLQKIFALNNPVVKHFDGQDFHYVSTLFKNLERESENPSADSHKVISNIVEVIFIYYFRKVNDKNYISKNNAINAVLFYIQENNRFLTDITLQEISKLTNYSAGYISKLFHKKYGATLVSYITSLRIEHAKKLLINTDLTVAEICLQSGFSSMSNFQSSFKKLNGCTPSQFRASVQSFK